MDRGFLRHVLISALAIGASIFSCCSAIAAEPDADASLKKFNAQFLQWQVLAQQGNAEGQYMSGMLLIGSSDPDVQAQGAQWLIKSVQQRYTPALTLMRQLADAGRVGFQLYLGGMYSEGTTVLQDYAEAARWYRLCAEKDNAACQLELGMMNFRGTGVPQDYVEAHKWFNLAAQGHFDAGVMTKAPQAVEEVREKAISNRNLLAAHMTIDQIAEAQRLAREWQRQYSLQAKQ